MALSDLNVRLGLLVEDFNRNLRRTDRQLRNFQRNVRGIGRDLTQAVTVPIVGIGVAAVDSFARIERLSKALETALGGSAEDARRELDALREVAQAPGLGFEQAVQGSVRLQSVGISAEQARETLSAFGNALALAGGTADQLDGVTLALTQISAKGKVFAEEINQINERVPQIRKVLQDAFGTSNTEELQELGITAEEFIRVVTSEFAKLPKAQQTLSNAFNNAGQSVRIFLADIGATIAETFDLNNLVQRFAAGLDSLAARFKALSPGARQFIVILAGITAAIGPLLFALGSIGRVFGTIRGSFLLLAGSFKALGASFTLLTGPVGIAVAAIVGLIALLVAAYRNSEQFRRVVKALGAALSSVVTSIGAFLKNVISRVVEFAKQFVPAFKGAGDGVANFAKIAINSLGAFLRFQEGVLRAAIAFVAEFVRITFEAVKGFADAFNQLREGDVTGAVKGLGRAIIQNNPITGTIRAGQRLASAFTDGFKGGFNEGVAANAIQAFNNALQTSVNETNETLSANPVQIPVQAQTFTTPTGEEQPIEERSPVAVPEEILSNLQKFNELERVRAELVGITTTAETAKNEALRLQAQRVDEISAAYERQKSVTKSLGDSFGTLFGNIVTGNKRASKSALEGIARVVSGLIKQGVAAAVANAFKFIPNPLVALGIGAAAGAAASALFNALLGKIGIPALATGGIATAPTLALIGEGSESEAVLPLSKLESLINTRSGGKLTGELRVDGRELVVLIEEVNERFV